MHSNNADADGYVIHCGSQSGIIANVFKKMPIRFTEEFVPLVRFQQDCGVLWIGAAMGWLEPESFATLWKYGSLVYQDMFLRLGRLKKQ